MPGEPPSAVELPASVPSLSDIELGLYTFAEVTPGAASSSAHGAGQRLKDLIEEIELADQVGLDVFGVGEHHRPDFAVSSPAVALAAAANALIENPWCGG